MYIPEEIVEEIISRIDIVDFISSYVNLKHSGSNYMGLCPFHNEKTPSFSVSRNKQIFHCFGCGEGGNVISFLMKYENLTFVEAIKILADRAGVALPEVNLSANEKKAQNERDIILKIYKEAAKFYFIVLKEYKDGLLKANPNPYDYFTKRALTYETIQKFGLGYSPKGSQMLYKYLKNIKDSSGKESFSDEILLKSGLFSHDERYGIKDFFWNRVMFPIMDVNSHVIGFGGRVMGDGMPKYKNSPESQIFDKSRNLYALNIAKKTKRDYFLLCEGYMDVIALHQAGFDNAIASLGTSLTEGHANLIKRYKKDVYLTYDSDGAGTKAAVRAYGILKNLGINARVIRMTPFKDPDEFIKARGAEAFEEIVDKARNGFMFTLATLETDYDMNSADGKTQFLKEAANRLTLFDEEIERNEYISEVARHYNVDEKAFRTLVRKQAISLDQAKEKRRYRSTKATGEILKASGKKAEEILLTWLIENPELFPQIKSYVNIKDFEEGIFRDVANIVYTQLEEGKLNIPKILTGFSDDEEKEKQVAAMLSARLEEFETVEKKKKALEDTIIKLKEMSIERERDSVDGSINSIQKDLEIVQKLEKLRRNGVYINL
ncbi:MAG: DNA primase [Lachnospiraceae bacterium]|jgi:DNA primase|nr:DNA primase [Lachnospiraceae bacterium]